MMRVPYQPRAPRSWRSRLAWLGGLVVVLLALGSVAFAFWALAVPAPMAEATAALSSTQEVAYSDDADWLVFSPTATSASTGFIFYPGGRVDPRAYAPAMQAIAQAGYLAIIVPMPLNLAVFAPGSARAVMAAYPQVEDWYIGGHSLGGAMAANYVYANPDCCAGLVLWAAYPAQDNSLSARARLRVLSLYATRDGLASQAEVLASQELLPASTRFVPIAGGNHAQFGWYGAQSGDNSATISRQEQQDRIVETTLQFLQAPR